MYLPLQMQKRVQILSAQLNECSWLLAGETQHYQHPNLHLSFPPPPLKDNRYGSFAGETEPIPQELFNSGVPFEVENLRFLKMLGDLGGGDGQVWLHCS